MALLRNEALNIKAGAGKANKLMDVGFSKATPVEEKKAPGFF